MNELSIIETAMYFAALLLVTALLLAFLRMAKGPDLPNRMLALDLIAMISIGVVVEYVFWVGDAVFLIVGVVQSLVGFSGTVAVAKHLERHF